MMRSSVLVAMATLSLFALPACGGGGGSSSATAPVPPSASADIPGLAVSAGSDQEVKEGAAVALQGQVTVDNGTAQLQWRQVSGPPVILIGENELDCGFTAPSVPYGDTLAMVLELTATTAAGSETSQTTVQVASRAFVLFERASTLEAPDTYLADVATGEVRALFQTATGAAPSNLSGLHLSPDGRWVAATHDGDVPGQFEVYVAAVDGSTVHKVSMPLPVDGDAGVAGWSPDSTRLALVADAGLDDVLEVYTVRPDGSGLVRCHPALGAGESSSTFVRWSPRGRSLAFQLELGGGDGYQRLFVVAPDGSDLVEISPPAPTGTPRGVGNYAWAGSESRLVFSGECTTDNVRELYSATTSPSVRTLNDPIPAGGEVRTFFLSPTGTRVAYLMDGDTVGRDELYISRTVLNTSVKVNGPLPGGDDVSFGGLAWSPDGSHLAYRAAERLAGVEELFVVAADGTGRVQVSAPITAAGSISTLVRWSGDGERILHGSTPSFGSVSHTYFSVKRDGSDPVMVTPPGGGDRAYSSFLVAPDGTTVAWEEFVVADGTRSIWTADLFTGGGAAPHPGLPHADLGRLPGEPDLVSGQHAAGLRRHAGSVDGRCQHGALRGPPGRHRQQGHLGGRDG